MILTLPNKTSFRWGEILEFQTAGGQLHTHTLFSKEQAWVDIDKLRDEIYSWTIEHSDEIGIDTTLCIGEGVEKTSKTPLLTFARCQKSTRLVHQAAKPGLWALHSCGCLNHLISEWLKKPLLPLATSQKLCKKLLQFQERSGQSKAWTRLLYFHLWQCWVIPKHPNWWMHLMHLKLALKKRKIKRKSCRHQWSSGHCSQKQQNYLRRSICHSRQNYCYLLPGTGPAAAIEISSLAFLNKIIFLLNSLLFYRSSKYTLMMPLLCGNTTQTL